MPVTYSQIATVLATGTTPISFNSLGSYTDLRLVVFSYMADDVYLRFNNDAGSNYSNNYIVGYGGNITASRTSNLTAIPINYTSGTSTNAANCVIDILGYSNSSFYKTVLVHSGYTAGTTSYVNLESARWASTSAITSIQVRGGSSGSAQFYSGTRFTLYGITAA